MPHYCHLPKSDKTEMLSDTSLRNHTFIKSDCWTSKNRWPYFLISALKKSQEHFSLSRVGWLYGPYIGRGVLFGLWPRVRNVAPNYDLFLNPTYFWNLNLTKLDRCLFDYVSKCQKIIRNNRWTVCELWCRTIKCKKSPSWGSWMDHMKDFSSKDQDQESRVIWF